MWPKITNEKVASHSRHHLAGGWLLNISSLPLWSSHMEELRPSICSHQLNPSRADWKHMLHEWVTEHKRPLKTAVMLSLRNDTSPRTHFLAFPAHFLFHTGLGAPSCLPESKGTGCVGLRSCRIMNPLSTTTTRRLLEGAAALFDLMQASFIKLCCRVYFLDSHIFTLGFVVSSQQMWSVCPWYGFCWTLLGGISPRPFNSPPDLTPFTLDKHNTKEENKFYVRGWVITCRKKGDSLIPLGG